MKPTGKGPPRAGQPDATDVIHDPRLPATLVRASAGTGKTYQLTARLLRILMQGAAPETVLATTFTRKAAGEILDRILLTLAAAANEADNPALEQLRQQVGIDDLTHRACRELLHRLIRNVHRLRICTLDSLFTQIARSFPFELGLPPAWRLTDEIEESWLRQRAVEQLIAELDSAEMTTLLSMLGKGETKRAVARELLQVVLAAYGQQRHCGNEAWKRLQAPKKPDSQALNDAIAMMRACRDAGSRHEKKLRDLAATLQQGELSSLAKDTLIRNIASSRRSKSPLTYYRKPFPPEVEPAFDTLYRTVCSETLGLLQFQNAATGQLLSIYDQHITQLKQSARTLGFDDVALRLAARFGKQVDGVNHRALARRMDGAINHVLLDEFQDTSPIQWQVLRPLAMQAAGGGEDDQADGSPADRSFFVSVIRSRRSTAGEVA